MKHPQLALPLSVSLLAAAAAWCFHETVQPPHDRGKAGNAASNPLSAAAASFKKLPLDFAAVGRPDQPAYLAEGAGYSMRLTAAGAEVRLRRGVDHVSTRAAAGNEAVIRARMLDAQADVAVAGESPLPGRSNYFVGRDRSQWRTGLAQYARVRYSGIYPGVDLVYYGNQQQLEYDFVVAPGADARRIRMAYSGADRLSLDAQGDLVLHAGGGELVQHRPLVYQDIDGRRRTVDARYRLDGAKMSEVSFVLGDYDHRKSLTIDPALSYSTYIGSGDSASSIALDGSGNIYLTGNTGASFPATSGAAQTSPGGGSENAFVAKLNPAGTALVYATYLGGTGYALGNGIAIDSSGNAYVTGLANGAFPTTGGALQTTYAGGISDAFVSKLSADGSTLLYSTYLGGNSASANAIAVNSAGDAYITGTVDSGGSIPATAAALQPAFGGGNADAFVAELNASGSALLYATYLGGAGNDGAAAIALDGSGDAYVAGTTSGSFPATAKSVQPVFGGATDAFVAELNPTGGALIYATYLGGSGTDASGAIAVDADGNAYVGGYTSGGFPIANAFQPTYGGGNDDGFVTEIAAGGASLGYSSYLGGSGVEEVNAIAVDAKGYVYAAGDTTGNFPVLNAVQPTYGGGADDGFVTVIAPGGGSVVASTYLGGGGDDVANAVAANGSGDVYVAGITTGEFPTTGGAFQPTLAGANGAFVAEISVTLSSSSSGGSSSSSSSGGSVSVSSGGGGGSLSPALLACLAGFAAWRRRRSA